MSAATPDPVDLLPPPDSEDAEPSHTQIAEAGDPSTVAPHPGQRPEGYVPPPIAVDGLPLPAATHNELVRRYREGATSGAASPIGLWRKANCVQPTDEVLLRYQGSLIRRSIRCNQALQVAYWLGWPIDLLGDIPDGLTGAPLAVGEMRWKKSWKLAAAEVVTDPDLHRTAVVGPAGEPDVAQGRPESIADDTGPDAPDAPDAPDHDLGGMTMGFAPPSDSMSLIAAWLGVGEPDHLAVVTEVLDDRTLFATGAAIRDLLDELDEIVGGGLEGFGAPRWFPFDTRDPDTIVPLIGWFGIPAGTIAADQPPVALRVFLGQLGPTLEVVAPPGDLLVASGVLAQFNDRRKARNPLRHNLLRVGGGPGSLSFRVADRPPVDRSAVVLPAGTWDLIDRYVLGPLRLTPSTRARAVLGSHSAVLVDGAAGTGKTTLCRVIAAELAGECTVVYVEPATSREALIEVYAAVQDLAPALVVIEHAEAAAPTRGTDMPLTLVQFAAAFDIAQAANAPIVSLLTTTEPTAIDGTFRQSSRMGLTIHLPIPDHQMRREMLTLLFSAVAEETEGWTCAVPADPDAVARVTDGATGADLQHLVRVAVLEALQDTEPTITTEAVNALAAARGWAGTDTGMYL